VNEVNRITDGTLFDHVFRAMTNIPSEVYFYATIASIVTSAGLYLGGRRHIALFVGEWAPTFLIAAVFYKLPHPSHEGVGERLGEAVSHITR
jgi:hypothetical protein